MKSASTSSHLSRQIVIITTTLLLVVTAFSYYYFGYVKEQENHLHEMGFRVLSRLGNNIIAKKKNVIKNAKNVVNTSLRKNLKPEIQTGDLNANSKNKEVSFTSISTFSNDDNRSFPIIREEYGVLKVSDTARCASVVKLYEFIIDLNQFSDPILHYDLFDDYMFLSNSEDSSGNIHFNTLASGFELENIDSLLGRSQGLLITTIQEVEIGGVKYQLFLQPHQIAPENSWIVCGFITRGKYNSMRMGISPTMIMFIFLIIVLTLLSIPFLKLWMISSLERLNILDAVFVIFSSIVGSSILVVLILHLYRVYGPDEMRNTKKLQEFGDNIINEFVNELEVALAQLEDFDEIYFEYSKEQNVDTNPLNELSNLSGQEDKAIKVRIPEVLGDSIEIVAKKYPLFDQIFWVDEGGMQKVKWTTKDEITNKIDISKRQYFKNSMSDNAWNLDDYRFSIESIYSWNTGKSMVGLGARSMQFIDSTIVVGMSSIFYSIIDPAIPQGHSFAFIEKNGDVWFHSDKTRNLQENIFEETDMNPHLRSLMYARKSDALSIKYHGKSYSAYVSPVDNLPLFLMVMYNSEYDKTKRAQVINFTLLHLFLYFILFLSMAIISKIIQKSKSHLRKKEVQYSWLWPQENNKTKYREIFISNSFTAFLLVVFTSFSNNSQSVALLYVASIVSFFYIFVKLKYGEITRGFWRRQMLSTLIFLLGILIIIVYNIVNGYWYVLLFILLLFLVFRFSRTLLIRVSLSSRNCYALMWVSWILIISIIPSFLFYRISYDQESELAIKHDQLQMAREISEKNSVWNNSGEREMFFASKNQSNNNLLKRGDIYASHLFDSVYISLDRKNKQSNSDKQGFGESDFYSMIASRIRPIYNDIVIQNNSLASGSPQDSLWWWFRDDKLNLVFSDYQSVNTAMKIQEPNQGDYRDIIVVSQLSSFHLPLFFINEKIGQNDIFPWFHQLNFGVWAFILSLIIALYTLIKFALKNIFAPNFITNDFYDIDDKLFRIDEEKKNVFLIGLPKCGKTKFLQNKFPDKNNKLNINLIAVFYENSWDELVKDAGDPKIEIIIIDHFEFNLENGELTQKKLELLEKLLLISNKKIIVSTSVQLANIKELYSKKSREEGNEALYRWLTLFKNFYEVYFPLQGFKTKLSKTKTYKIQPDSISNLLQTEFNHGFYLKELRPEIEKLIDINDQNGIPSDYDQIVKKIQSLCSVYYHLLWSTCTENEKYIIYDLAEDGLVNTKNFETIEILLNKGLIIFTNSLRLMNDSFRNFVLTKIGPTEAMLMEKKANKSGTWTMFRNPLIIVLLAIAGFLLFTQQDSVHTALSFLTPMLALIPAIIKILGLLARKKTESSSAEEIE